MNTKSLNRNDAINAGVEYYDGPDLVAGLIDALHQAGLDERALDIDDLAALDEFHALGRAATIALARLTDLQPGERVLDVGSGIGGPARFLASRYGVTVTAIDVTERFCRAAEMLTRGADLADRVTIVCGDALSLPFADESFDVVWTQAVSQNIFDKRRFISELVRVLRPGGRAAMFEIVAGPSGPLVYPVPWADTSEQSAVGSAEELEGPLKAEGLTFGSLKRGQAVLESIVAAAEEVTASPAHQRLGLQLLMPDYEARMAGLARNVAEQRIETWQAIATRPLTS